MSVGFVSFGASSRPVTRCQVRVAPEGRRRVVIYSIGVSFMLSTGRKMTKASLAEGAIGIRLSRQTKNSISKKSIEILLRHSPLRC